MLHGHFDLMRSIILAEGDPNYTCFWTDHQDVIWFGKRLVVPADPEIKKIILDEAHKSKFSIHPDSTKCDNPPRKIPYYRLRPIHFGH
jgi:hypothetical protein